MTTTALKVVSAHTTAESVTHGTVIPFRAYDNPRLDARGFLEAVMHSPHVSLTLRQRAAEHLLKLGPPQPAVCMVDNEQPVIKYIIGGIPS